MNRRYDIDWLRVFALGLLIIYHISIVFQPWAYFIYFPQSEKPIESIWLVMGLINIWRIPLLFIISGMGVYLAMRRRNWKELLKDRIIRILLPLIFGSLIIVPIHVYIYQAFMGLGEWILSKSRSSLVLRKYFHLCCCNVPHLLLHEEKQE